MQKFLMICAFLCAFVFCSNADDINQSVFDGGTPPETLVNDCNDRVEYIPMGRQDFAPIVLSDASYDAGPLLGARVFVYGNSLVYGLNATQSTYFKNLLGPKWDTSIFGRGGWTTSMLITAAPHDLAAANSENRSVKVLVFWEGVNEMGSPFNCEAYEIMTRKRIAEGWKVVLINATTTASTADVSPDGGLPAYSIWRDWRHTFNACVKQNYASWGAVGLIDIDTIPQLLNPYDTQYYTDKVHLTSLGYKMIADRIANLVAPLYKAP